MTIPKISVGDLVKLKDTPRNKEFNFVAKLINQIGLIVPSHDNIYPYNVKFDGFYRPIGFDLEDIEVIFTT